MHDAKKFFSKKYLLNKRLFFLLFIFALVSYSLFQLVVKAQQSGQGLEVSPPSQEVKVNPGETTTIRAKIRNRTDKNITIKVRIEDFTALGDQGQVELTSDSKFSVKSWTIVEPSSLNLDPGEEKEVKATLSVPADAAGGRYGSFVFGVASEEKPNSAALTQEIASLFLVKISGPVDENLVITDLIAPKFSEFGPIQFNINVKNNGNVYVKAYGLINVVDMFGKKVKDVVIYETNVFPGANRIIEGSLDNKFLIGKFTATSLLYYGTEQNQSLTATAVFYVFPLRIVITITVILLVLYLGRKRISKAFKALNGK